MLVAFLRRMKGDRQAEKTDLERKKKFLSVARSHAKAPAKMGWILRQSYVGRRERSGVSA
jgi:hypothetical protein